MNRISIAIVASAAVFCSLIFVAVKQVSGWGKDAEPIMGEIQHETVVYYPAPRDRTDIAIGEQVYCWLDSSTWYDRDIHYLPGGGSEFDTDTIGEVSWIVEGGGSLSSATGYNTMLTANLQSGMLNLQAKIKDSGQKGRDKVLIKQENFQKQKPTGIKVWYQQDLQNEFAPAGPPNNKVGSGTLFTFQVQPDNVDFSGILFRENIPKQTWQWPDGNQGVFNAIMVNYLVETDPNTNAVNMGADRSRTLKTR